VHGTILDAKGQRMSKSKGNGIDPLDMVAQYGADAVRFSLLTLTSEGQDIKLAPSKFEMGRNFANKTWNAVRFVLPHTKDVKNAIPEKESLDMVDKWILSRLNTLIEEVTGALEKYRFADACNAIYHFTWNDFCSRYLEIRKKVITAEHGSSQKTTTVSIFLSVLNNVIALLHPFMPFITEEIQSNLENEDMLITSKWPEADESLINKNLESDFGNIMAVVDSIRSIRGAYSIPRSTKMQAVVRFDDDNEFTPSQREIIENLENLESLTCTSDREKPQFSAAAVIPGGQVFVILKGILDITAERAKMEKELQKTNDFINSLTAKLSNEKFIQNAPGNVVTREKEKLNSQKEKAAKLSATIKELS
jgi:valyl-tRNA synthetase